MDIAQSPVRFFRISFRFLTFLVTALQGCAHYGILRLTGRLSTMDRAEWLHHWCETVLRRIGTSISSEGSFPKRGLLVSNHLSYLDILVYSALSPCVFVSKKEVRYWPLIGAMAAMGGTVFVDRTRSSETPRVTGEMTQALTAGAVVVLFPEGTSSSGSSILPFRPALFEAAVGSKEQISCAYLKYQIEDGSVADEVCYWGNMSFFPHLLHLLGKNGLSAQVTFAGAARKFDDRKQAAQLTHETVSGLGGFLVRKD